MRASELIALLFKMMRQHGDLFVLRSTNNAGEVSPQNDALYVMFAESQNGKMAVFGREFKPAEVPNWTRIKLEGE